MDVPAVTKGCSSLTANKVHKLIRYWSESIQQAAISTWINLSIMVYGFKLTNVRKCCTGTFLSLETVHWISDDKSVSLIF